VSLYDPQVQSLETGNIVLGRSDTRKLWLAKVVSAELS